MGATMAETLGFEIFATDRASNSLRSVSKTAKETAVTVELAQIRVAKATEKAATAAQKYGSGSLQAREASARLAQSQLALEKQTKRTSETTERSGGTMSKFKDKLGTAAVFKLTDAVSAAGQGLVEFAKGSIEAASSVNESQSKVQVVFGQSAGQVAAFANVSAKSFGISKAAALEAAGTFGNLFVALKLPQEQAATMSVRLEKLAADMASFNNASPAEVLEAIRAGLVGETEPLRRFGVNMNDATLRQEALSLGLVKTTKDVLPPAVKAQAAYALMLDQTKTAQGDFARTSGGLANQQRILAASLEDQKAALGAKLLPLWVGFAKALNNVVLPAVTGVAGAFANSPGAVKMFAGVFVGVASSAVAAAYAIKGVSAAIKTVQEASTLVGIARFAGMLASPWTLAVAGATAVLGFFINRHQQAVQRVKDLTASLDANTGAFTANTREVVINRLQKEGIISQAQKLGLNLNDVTLAAMGNADALGRLDAANHGNLLSLLASGKQAGATGIQYSDLRGKITGVSSDLGKAVEAGKQHTATQTAMTTALKDTSAQAAVLAYWNGQMKQAAAEQTAAQAALVTELDATKNALLQLRGGEDAYWASLQATADALKANGRTLDVHTVKGRANREALDAQAKASLGYLDTLRQQNVPAKQFNARLDEAKQRLYDAALKFSGSKKQAKAYTDAILGIPHVATTRVLIPGMAGARHSVQALKGDIQAINGKTVRIAVNADGSLTRRLFDATGRQTGSATVRAAGGILPGPPSRTDNMLIHAASGEYVVNASATSRHRGLLEAINASGYASGGLITIRGSAKIPRGYGSFVNSRLDSAMGNAAMPDISGSGGGGGNTANMAIGHILAALRGWTGSMWSSLRALWIGESGWNNRAKNPTSTAFGIPQFLAGTARQYGVYGVTNPSLQILAGMRYIADVYGNPSRAYARWLGRSPHWYDQGGMLPPGLSLAYNGTGRPERVLGPHSAGGEVHIHLHNHGIITSPADFDDWASKSFDRLRRQGRLAA
jgi:hypothetical protein